MPFEAILFVSACGFHSVRIGLIVIITDRAAPPPNNLHNRAPSAVSLNVIDPGLSSVRAVHDMGRVDCEFPSAVSV